LGRLEELAARVARIQVDVKPSVERKAIVLAAADHGVVAEGVSAYPQDVTWQMVANFSAGGAAINQLAASVGAEVAVYDVGVAADTQDFTGVEQVKVARGTQNMALGPAMSREECARAVLVGVEVARELAERGFRLLGTGEMGIGNSTAAAALTSVFAGASPESVVGPGTGLDAAGVAHKAEVIRRALLVNHAVDLDALGVLAAVGGLEIAMLAGVVIGAAQEGVCVVTDGYISGAATLAAVALCPLARDYVFPSHLSVEPGHALVLGALDLEPVLDLDMRLGEGTGAALAFGIIDAACRMISGMATFDEAGVAHADA
jgi:nicotinate-nucleotide--dimethylbenzimidazole phosphoribosyltransferase